MIGKKAQEEIVGFVLIMVIIAIVALIFLGISIRQGGVVSSTESSDIYQFLESTMEYTSSCAFSSTPLYYSLGELFEECYIGNACLDGVDSCSVLNHTLTQILIGSWNVDAEARVRGYRLVSEYVVNSSDQGDQVISLEKGNCTGSADGATYVSPAFPGKIRTSLRICY